MSDELSMAERLRAIANMGHRIIMENGFNWDDEANTLLEAADMLEAEHPADDAEPVTRERLMELSVSQFYEALMWSYDFGGGLGVIGVDDDPPEAWKWTLNTRPNQYADLPAVKTWRQFRTLCAALGVELNERKETSDAG